mmetsp:Transcript_29467/g.82292  ORF Transcript_29467/g.82292 Transcript_29467/m.82292 type:complete len:920 (-) Transcript_29467:589-3348(-)
MEEKDRNLSPNKRRANAVDIKRGKQRGFMSNFFGSKPKETGMRDGEDPDSLSGRVSPTRSVSPSSLKRRLSPLGSRRGVASPKQKREKEKRKGFLKRGEKEKTKKKIKPKPFRKRNFPRRNTPVFVRTSGDLPPEALDLLEEAGYGEEDLMIMEAEGHLIVLLSSLQFITKRPYVYRKVKKRREDMRRKRTQDPGLDYQFTESGEEERASDTIDLKKSMKRLSGEYIFNDEGGAGDADGKGEEPEDEAKMSPAKKSAQDDQSEDSGESDLEEEDQARSPPAGSPEKDGGSCHAEGGEQVRASGATSPDTAGTAKGLPHGERSAKVGEDLPVGERPSKEATPSKTDIKTEGSGSGSKGKLAMGKRPSGSSNGERWAVRPAAGEGSGRKGQSTGQLNEQGTKIGHVDSAERGFAAIGKSRNGRGMMALSQDGVHEDRQRPVVRRRGSVDQLRSSRENSGAQRASGEEAWVDPRAVPSSDPQNSFKLRRVNSHATKRAKPILRGRHGGDDDASGDAGSGAEPDEAFSGIFGGHRGRIRKRAEDIPRRVTETTPPLEYLEEHIEEEIKQTYSAKGMSDDEFSPLANRLSAIYSPGGGSTGDYQHKVSKDSKLPQKTMEDYLSSGKWFCRFRDLDGKERNDIESTYHIDKLIGKGGFGEVFTATGPKKAKYALKKQANKKASIQAQNYREIAILIHMKHPNIVELANYYYCSSEVWMVMEFLEGGSLSEAVSKREMSEKEIAFVAYGVLSALDFLHRNQFVHRDLKSANIMLSVNGKVKVIDFGLAGDMSQYEKPEETRMLGSPFWISPEMVQQKPHTFTTDVWSLGISLLEMSNGAPPCRFNGLRALILIGTEGISRPFKKPSKWSKTYHDFINQCLEMDAKERPTAADILQHPFLESRVSQENMSKIITSMFISDALETMFS